MGEFIDTIPTSNQSQIKAGVVAKYLVEVKPKKQTQKPNEKPKRKTVLGRKKF